MAKANNKYVFEKPDWFNNENYENNPFSKPLEIAQYLTFYNAAAVAFKYYQREHEIDSYKKLLSVIEKDKIKTGDDGKTEWKSIESHLSNLKDKYLPIDERKGLTPRAGGGCSRCGDFQGIDYSNGIATLTNQIDTVDDKVDGIVELFSWGDGVDVKVRLDMILESGGEPMMANDQLMGLEKTYLSIDLEAENSDLIKSFRNLLFKLRRQQGGYVERLQSTYDKIRLHKSIQILDLKLYASLIGQDCPAPFLLKNLFPAKFEIHKVGDRAPSDWFEKIIKPHLFTITKVAFIDQIRKL